MTGHAAQARSDAAATLRTGGGPWEAAAPTSHPLTCLPVCGALPPAAVPATVIALESSNYVTQVKTVEKDGYAAVQVRWRGGAVQSRRAARRVAVWG